MNRIRRSIYLLPIPICVMFLYLVYFYFCFIFVFLYLCFYICVISFKLCRYVKHVHYEDPNGKLLCFNDKGEIPCPLDIANWVTTNVSYRIPMGYFDGSLSDDQQLILEPELISRESNKVSNIETQI